MSQQHDKSPGPSRPEVVAALAVAEVTLSEDRAHVTRRGRAELPRGQVTVVVEGVAPVLGDKTLCASVVSPAVEVVDVRARRERVVAEAHRPEALRALDVELEALEDRLAARRAAVARLDAEQRTLGDALAEALAEMTVDASWGKTDEGAWGGELGRLRSRRGELGERLLEERRLAREDEEEAARLRARRAAAESPSGRVRAAIEVDLLVPEAGEQEIQVDYVTPSACWRPYHVARLLEGEDRIAFATEACVWQRTGEDWEEVQLLLSTQRPSEGVEPPLLATDLLAVGPRSPAVVLEARDQQVHTAGLGRAEAPPSEGGGLPGIDDGGEELTLRARGRATVPSDGRPYRFELFGFEAEAKAEIVAMPELAEAALWRCVQTNEGDRPILAGPVDLVRAGGLVGRTTVLFVAPGERFPLGFGPEGSIRIHREVEVQDEEGSLLSSWRSRVSIVTVRLSNIGPEEGRLTLTERVPVSEIDKVQIVVDREETTGGQLPDDQGHLRWTVRLPPFSTETVRLRYVVKKRGEVAGAI